MLVITSPCEPRFFPDETCAFCEGFYPDCRKIHWQDARLANASYGTTSCTMWSERDTISVLAMPGQQTQEIPTRGAGRLVLRNGSSIRSHTHNSSSFPSLCAKCCRLLDSAGNRKESTMIWQSPITVFFLQILYKLGRYATSFSEIKFLQTDSKPITVAARSKALTVFARSNAGIVGSNRTRGMDVCVRLFCFCVGLWVGRDHPPFKESYNWRSGQGPTKGLYSHR
jgi:hypothetical protein